MRPSLTLSRPLPGLTDRLAKGSLRYVMLFTARKTLGILGRFRWLAGVKTSLAWSKSEPMNSN